MQQNFTQHLPAFNHRSLLHHAATRFDSSPLQFTAQRFNFTVHFAVERFDSMLQFIAGSQISPLQDAAKISDT
jgi:hypothetical protein